MRLTLAMLGWSFDVSIEPTTETSENDPLRDLGALGSESTSVDLGPSELFMGFTNGREGCADPEDGRRT